MEKKVQVGVVSRKFLTLSQHQNLPQMFPEISKMNLDRCYHCGHAGDGKVRLRLGRVNNNNSSNNKMSGASFTNHGYQTCLYVGRSVINGFDELINFSHEILLEMAADQQNHV